MRRPRWARREARRASRRDVLERSRALRDRPVISVVMPTYETETRWLRAAIDSVRRQAYPEWELCIADDGSRSRAVRREIERQAGLDPRIRFAILDANRGISAATNAALELASGEFVAFLDHDDALTPDALLTVAEALDRDPQPDVVYSDSDKLDGHGLRADPFLKPDWSPVYALGAMYIGHLLVVRRSLTERVGGFDSRFDSIQDFEFMLRVSEATQRIHHVPRILYHWRAIPGSIAAGPEQKSGVEELQAAAVAEHLRRVGAPVEVRPHPEIPHRTRLSLAPGAERPLVSAIFGPVVDPRRRARAMASVAGAGLELIGVGEVDGLGDRAEAVPADPAGTCAAALNRAAARARGSWLLFCADWIEAPGGDWLDPLLAHAALPGVTAVAPLLVRPDGRVEAAGCAIGLDAPVVRAFSGTEGDGDGYYGTMACAREVSAASGDFLLVERRAFEDAGGFEEAYAAEYADHDLCRRLWHRGGRVVYAPAPRIVTHETPAERRARVDIVDRALFVDCWYDDLERGDPYFSVGFSRVNANFVVDPGRYDAGSRPAR